MGQLPTQRSGNFADRPFTRRTPFGGIHVSAEGTGKAAEPFGQLKPR